MLKPRDLAFLRLFSDEEKQACSDAIQQCGATSFVRPRPGQCYDVAAKLRQRVLLDIASYLEWIGRDTTGSDSEELLIEQAQRAFRAPEFQALCAFRSEIEHIASRLASVEDAGLSFDETTRIVVDLGQVWSNFVSAAHHRVARDIPAELAAKNKRTKIARKAAVSERQKKHDPDEIMVEFRRLRASGHTESQARGLMTSWGRWSQSTIYRATAKKKSSR